MGLFKRHEKLLERVRGARTGTTVTLEWTVAGETPPTVRVLRSVYAAAERAQDADLPAMEQTLAFEGVGTGLRDDDLVESADIYYYTFFAQDADGAWRDQVCVELARGAAIEWSRDDD
jgi:hypothetical protein